MSMRDQLAVALDSGEPGRVLELLKLPEINQQIKTEESAADLVPVLASTFVKCVRLFSENVIDFGTDNAHNVDEIIYECCRLLRNSCAIGQSIQNQIIGFQLESHSILSSINVVLFDLPKTPSKLAHKTRKMCWQFVANSCVQNPPAQRDIWHKSLEPLLSQLNCVCNTGAGRECTMILYNLFISEILNTNDVKRVTELLMHCISDRSDQHELQSNDFHQLFMEHFITKYRSAVSIYDRITPLEKRIHVIYYMADHMREVRHDPISTPLLQFICKEFKKKSDCVLRVNNSSATDQIHPREVVALLEVIAQASSDERYSHILSNDGSLFLNVGCLLRSIHDIGKRQSTGEIGVNIFAPVQKLNQLAPNSSEDSSIERDISYQLKSTLIRTLANLTYKNKTNQDLARDMEFIMVVLDSTALDARNPLIKEWSILAIRNLCENNPENQTIIRQLTKVGDSKSDIIKELNLDLGSLRINPNVENDQNC